MKTADEIYNAPAKDIKAMAGEYKLKGRSKMSTAELREALVELLDHSATIQNVPGPSNGVLNAMPKTIGEPATGYNRSREAARRMKQMERISAKRS